MRVIVLRTCCVAPPAANDWFWNVPRLEYTASALAPFRFTVFAPGTEGASGTRRTHCRSPPGWSNTCAFAGAQMAQATTIALASNDGPKAWRISFGREL